MNYPHFNQQRSLTTKTRRPCTAVGRKWSSALLTSLAAVWLLHADSAIGQESALAVTAVSPANSATAVPVNAGVTATFSQAIDPLTVNSSTFELLDPSDAVVPATITYDSNTLTATLTPSSALAYSATYTATLKGGTPTLASKIWLATRCRRTIHGPSPQSQTRLRSRPAGTPAICMSIVVAEGRRWICQPSTMRWLRKNVSARVLAGRHGQWRGAKSGH